MRRALPRVLIGCLLVIVFLAGAAWAGAQRFVTPPGSRPLILSGSDIGFRMAGRKGDTVVGSLVVRVNGEWIATEYAFGLKPAK